MAEPQVTGDQTPQGDGGTPQFATASQVAQMVNQAISARGKVQEEKLSKLIEEKLTAFAGGLNAKLEELNTQEPGKKNKKGADDDPAVRGLERKMADMQAAYEKTQKELQAERTRAKDRDLRGQVGELLTSSGIDGTRVKHALAWLVDSSKSVRYAEDGETIVFADSTGAEIDLPTGIKSWLGTDDGKAFMPAAGALGAGGRPGSLKRPDVKPDQVSLERALGALITGQIS